MSAAPRLVDAYDALLIDLDGVVHLGGRAIPAAPPSLAAARASGCHVVFVTNNASRTPAEVAGDLTALGVQTDEHEVLTSSMAAARALREQLPNGAPVLVVGGDGLRAPLRDAGLTPTDSAEDEPQAVVQGWSPDLTWGLLAEGAVALRRGVPWVVTNRDATLPSPRGPLPGNGSMVAALALATSREPTLVVGKPESPLFAAAVERAGATRPLFVGDRLDTDIAGANRAGLPSLLVLSGVSRASDLLAASPQSRPTYLGRDLGAITGAAAALESDDVAGDDLDGFRQLCRRVWRERQALSTYDAELRRLGLD